MKWLIKPMGRLGFIISLPVLGLLFYASVMLILAKALQYPGHVPEGIEYVYLAYGLIWFVPAVVVQVKRLRSIGLNIWLSLIFSLVAPCTLLFWQGDWKGLIPVAVWVAALAYKRPEESEKPQLEETVTEQTKSE